MGTFLLARLRRCGIWRVKLAVGLAAMFVFGFGIGSASADPSPFASAAGSCDAGPVNSRFSIGTQTANHPAVLARLQTTGGPGRVDLGDFQFPEPAARFTAADTIWFVAPPVLAGQQVGGMVECPARSSFTYTFGFFDVPQVPASFSGASTFDA